MNFTCNTEDDSHQCNAEQKSQTQRSNYHMIPFTTYFVVVVGWAARLDGILVPQPETEPGPQQSKCRVLTTGLPGNSLQHILKMAIDIYSERIQYSG